MSPERKLLRAAIGAAFRGCTLIMCTGTACAMWLVLRALAK